MYVLQLTEKTEMSSLSLNSPKFVDYEIFLFTIAKFSPFIMQNRTKQAR